MDQEDEQIDEDLEEGQQGQLLLNYEDQEENEEEDVEEDSLGQQLLNYNKMMLMQNGGAKLAASANAGDLMQPFLFECQDEQLSVNHFVPCMVYLPVKAKLSSQVNVRITLKPLDQTGSSLLPPSSPSSATSSLQGKIISQQKSQLEKKSQMEANKSRTEAGESEKIALDDQANENSNYNDNNQVDDDENNDNNEPDIDNEDENDDENNQVLTD